jgi:L-ascorbate metabolism protein UlaG (beta-lactamase superfamily)
MLHILSYLVVGFAAVSLLIGYLLSAPRYRGEVSDHFNGKAFFNPGAKQASGFGPFFKWMLQREQGSWSEMQETSVAEIPAARIESGIRITFVNHSTFLIQVDGLNLLTDPIWSERSSPVSWAGPKRMRAPGIRFEELPPIDVVLLSHNHYDHLDVPTLKKLFQQHRPRVIAPLGIKTYLEATGIGDCIEADWWDELKLSEAISLHIVPAQHFSGRGLFDRNATLWGGYIIHTNSGNIFFAGDTGYKKDLFEQIGRLHSPVRVALLPIGAYKPVWFMSPIHISPDEAVRVHLDLKAETSIAMHFGTFPLADDGQTEPVRDLKTALEKWNVPKGQFVVLKEGTYFEVSKNRTVKTVA